jgi:hypothetical protein
VLLADQAPMWLVNNTSSCDTGCNISLLHTATDILFWLILSNECRFGMEGATRGDGDDASVRDADDNSPTSLGVLNQASPFHCGRQARSRL